MAVELGFEKMILKDETVKCYFINRPDSPYFESDTFKGILNFIQTRTNKASLKQVGKLFLLIVDDIKTMKDLHSYLSRMIEFVKGEVPII